jgi:hypothetical protein
MRSLRPPARRTILASLLALSPAGPAFADGERAVVIADFVSHRDMVRTVLRYLLVRENGGWKVDDIIASGKNEWRVRKLVRGTAGK